MFLLALYIFAEIIKRESKSSTLKEAVRQILAGGWFLKTVLAVKLFLLVVIAFCMMVLELMKLVS